jgi:hypothetical protein
VASGRVLQNLRPIAGRSGEQSAGTAMTGGKRHTAGPFTAVVCTNCRSDATAALLAALRDAVRRCPHGVLVTTGCVLGELTCAARRETPGVMAALQPCSVERAPIGPPCWIGPIYNDDARAVADWIEHGHWGSAALPDRLRHDPWWRARHAHRN